MQSQLIIITHHNDRPTGRPWQHIKGDQDFREAFFVTKQGWNNREWAEASVF